MRPTQVEAELIAPDRARARAGAQMERTPAEVAEHFSYFFELRTRNRAVVQVLSESGPPHL